MSFNAALSCSFRLDACPSAIEHLTTYSPPRQDLRKAIRAIEAEILSTHAAALICNQALDFKKQDGVTEIEESLEANVVERRLNDALIEDELLGKLTIGRDVAFVGCVRNFSDLRSLLQLHHHMSPVHRSQTFQIFWICVARRCETWSWACRASENPDLLCQIC